MLLTSNETSGLEGVSDPPSVETDMVIVGAGAKAAAIASKVHVINSLGWGPIEMTIIEATEPASSWSGRNGLTSGSEPLAVTPVKDIGFPYQSHQVFGRDGDAIDRGMAAFSWQQFLISERRYSRWVDAGSPAVQHREYGQYLTWVLSQATEGVTLVRGRVSEISLDGREDRWLVDVAESSAAPRYSCEALTLTGPGVHRGIAHEPGAAARIFHCDCRRAELARIPVEQRSEVAIVGGGESALSCLALLRSCRPNAIFTIYTPNLPMSRAESFLENRVFSNPDSVAWSSLSLQCRRDFIKHSDRGVFDPQTLSEIAYDERCRFVTGRVLEVTAGDHGKRVRVAYRSAIDTSTAEHDYVVNCTGFDLLEQLRLLLSESTRTEVERQVGTLWVEPAPDEDLPIGRNLEFKGLTPRLHVPGIAALSQGPGFANLGGLGVLANRVLQPFLFEQSAMRAPASTLPRARTVHADLAAHP
jgi:mycobactin lysine-N-oxygenase